MAYHTVIAGWAVYTPVSLIMVNVLHLPYFNAYDQLYKSGGGQKDVNANFKRVYEL